MVSVAPTFNEQLFDAVLRHQIGLQRFAGSLRNRTWVLLDATEADLKRQIRQRAARAGLDSPARVRRLNKLLEVARASRVRAWEDVTELWAEELRGLALAEPGFFDRAIASAVPIELGSVLPEPEVLRNIVRSRPFLGKTLNEWAKDVRRADLDRIESAIKVGMVQGEGPTQIARRVVGTARLRGRDGVTQITRRNAEAIVRTVTNGIGAEARREYSLLNQELAPQELFVATLDARTTPICRRFDGERFDVGTGPLLPLHFGERSVRIPVLDGEVVGNRPIRNFTRQQLLREYARAEGLPAISARAKLPRGHKGRFDAFARQRMRELTGTVPARTTYGDFLKRQTVEVQNDILGPLRARLFRSGGLTLDKFVLENGRELTLAELATRHTDAFLSAGLNPSRFAA